MMTRQQAEALKAMFISAQPPDVEPMPSENPQELWPPPVQPQTPLPSVAAGQMLKQRPPNPQMEAPVITEAKSAIERLQNPEKKHWLVQMVQNAAEGLGAWDQSPAQFQQNQQRKQLLAEQQKQTELQRQEQRIANEYSRQDRETQAARQREQDERQRQADMRTAAMFPMEQQKTQADIAFTQARTANELAPPPAKPAEGFSLGPGQQRFDAQGNPIASVPPTPREPTKPDYEWIIRNGKEMYVPKTSIQPGDKPYRESQVPPTQSPYAAERALRAKESVEALKKKVSPFTVGLGSLLSYIPATEATDFLAELETLKSNIITNELTEMRNASKTGGALGQVSDKEAAFLSSALGALNPRQSAKNFGEQLDRIQASLDRWQAAVAQRGNQQPQSEETKTVNGVTYRKVPGGWQAVNKPQ